MLKNELELEQEIKELLGRVQTQDEVEDRQSGKEEMRGGDSGETSV